MAIMAGKRVKQEIGTGTVGVVGSSPHKGNAEILKAEKLKSGIMQGEVVRAAGGRAAEADYHRPGSWAPRGKALAR